MQFGCGQTKTLLNFYPQCNHGGSVGMAERYRFFFLLIQKYPRPKCRVYFIFCEQKTEIFQIPQSCKVIHHVFQI